MLIKHLMAARGDSRLPASASCRLCSFTSHLRSLDIVYSPLTLPDICLCPDIVALLPFRSKSAKETFFRLEGFRLCYSCYYTLYPLKVTKNVYIGLLASWKLSILKVEKNILISGFVVLKTIYFCLSFEKTDLFVFRSRRKGYEK